MKKYAALILSAVLLTGCAAPSEKAEPSPAPTVSASSLPAETTGIAEETVYDEVTEVSLEGHSVSINGIAGDTKSVFVSHDIVYYEDRDTYESGNPYGEGSVSERHSTDEAAGHTVVNITAPGTYRLHGTMAAGQIRVDLGSDAKSDPDAVVNLILDGVDITCAVAPALLFRNVYECDADRTTENASPTVDTTAAGANLILAAGSVNTIHGSHVAKVYKDNSDSKKLVKQDGAVYSYMSMNIDGSGTLDVFADNEGVDAEMHLTINGGTLNIRSNDDGINTNEDGVSVTTINGGDIHIIAGLGQEGDGIDSNGYLVINGGTVVAAANPASDSGLDSDMGSYINGGTVVALGSTMDWAESDSDQVTMNLQFADYRTADCAIVVTREDGSVVFAYDPGEDEVLGENARRYLGAVISSPAFAVGDTYNIFLDGTLTGTEAHGFYSDVTAYDGGQQQMYTGSDMGIRGHGGFDRIETPGFRPGDRTEPFSGERPKDFDEERPEGFAGERPEGFGGERPEGFGDGRPGGFDGEAPRDFGEERPEMPQGGEPGMIAPGFPLFSAASGEPGEGSTAFFMQDKVNAFSGVTAAVENIK